MFQVYLSANLYTYSRRLLADSCHFIRREGVGQAQDLSRAWGFIHKAKIIIKFFQNNVRLYYNMNHHEKFPSHFRKWYSALRVKWSRISCNPRFPLNIRWLMKYLKLSVVYFDQQMGAPHTVCRSKSIFWSLISFLMLKQLFYVLFNH